MDKLVAYLTTALPTALIFGIVVAVVILRYYTTVKSVLGDFLHFFRGGFRFVGKAATAYQLEGKIGSAIQHVTRNTQIIPYGFEVEWRKEEDKETFLRRNKVVVVLDKQEPSDRQFVRAAMELVRCALIPMAKLRMDKRVLDAVDTKFAQSIVKQRGVEAVGYFEKTFLVPYFNREEEKLRIYDKLRCIEKNGMFCEMLLNEFENVARDNIDGVPSEVLERESREFLDFVYNIASRDRGAQVQLSFVRQYFRVAVLLATRDDVIGFGSFEGALDDYIRQLQKNIDHGVWKIYIYALGRKVDVAKEIAFIINQVDARVSDVKYHQYKKVAIHGGREIEGICIELSASKVGI